MTQLQKVAWMNIMVLPLIVALIILARIQVLTQTLTGIFLILMIAMEILVAVALAKKPWQKRTTIDERDTLVRQKGYQTAFWVMACCLVVGLVVLLINYPTGPVPLDFLVGWIGVGFAVSLISMPIAILVGYRKCITG